MKVWNEEVKEDVDGLMNVWMAEVNIQLSMVYGESGYGCRTWGGEGGVKR